MVEYTPLWTNYERRAIQLAKLGTLDPQVEQFRWLLEELRVGLYAQELRTPVPVSTLVIVVYARMRASRACVSSMRRR